MDNAKDDSVIDCVDYPIGTIIRFHNMTRIMRLPDGGWSNSISDTTYKFGGYKKDIKHIAYPDDGLSKGMISAKVFERDGIEFIPMPVTSDVDRKVLIGFLEERLEELKGVSNESR